MPLTRYLALFAFLGCSSPRAVGLPSVAGPSQQASPVGEGDHLRDLLRSRLQCAQPLPLDSATVSSHFGPRKVAGYPREFHPGIDLAAKAGVPVRAVQPGRVIAAGGPDHTVTVWTGYGRFSQHVSYSHLRDVHVARGDHVALGQIIGTVGNTGSGRPGGVPWAFSAHLHLGVREKDPRSGNVLHKDPAKALGLCRYRSVANRNNVAYEGDE